MLLAQNCGKDKETPTTGTLEGTVSARDGSGIDGVSVKVGDLAATTAGGGRYSIAGVGAGSKSVSFAKTGYKSQSKTVNIKAGGTSELNAALEDASSKIIGIVTNREGEYLSGVSASIGAAGSAQSDENGMFVIENVAEDAYTLTLTYPNFATITKRITAAAFVNKTADMGTIKMGLPELLRDKTIDDLRSARVWHYNEYRGGGNANFYPHWDWSTNYMRASLDFYGDVEEQWEGTALRTRNDEANRVNPADPDVFDSYAYGKKYITEWNKILSLEVRTHNATAASPAHFGVQVVDLSAAEPAPAVKAGETKTHSSEQYEYYTFDLSAYVGKEVIVAVGIYRMETGDYWKQLPIRTLRFAPQAQTGNWLSGNEIINGWHLTTEMALSTMRNDNKSFTGVSPAEGGRDMTKLNIAFPAWAAMKDPYHIAAQWSLMPVSKDPEPFASYGFVIKTNSNGTISTEVPEQYFYAKFAIAAGSNIMKLKARNRTDEITYFKLTAIPIEDGNVPSAPVHIVPTANVGEAASDGCWKFTHTQGDPSNPSAYAEFTYDLSAYNGKDVVLVLGVYEGENNGKEEQLAIYSIDFE
jgi:hypothetical protein